jgi:hypothetical protein
MEAVLQGNLAAQRFLNNDPAGVLRARGVGAMEHSSVRGEE